MNIQRVIAMSRPRFWSYLVGSYLIGYTLGSQNVNDFFSFQFLYTFFYFLIPANLFLYGINDYFDRIADRKNPKEMPAVLNFTLISLIFTLPLFAYLNPYSLVVLLCFLLLSAFYSTPPVRFKTMPFFDSASNMLYLLPGILGYAQFSQPSLSIFTILFLSCMPAGIHLLSTTAHIEADRRAGINTSATYLGKTRSLIACLILLLIFAIYATSVNPLFVISFIYPSIPLYLLYHDEVTVESLYLKLPFANALMIALLFGYLYISKFYL